ncbi:YlxQ-related RNA-binding protein [Lapidilactobacillus gannanensis]|uniref:YlxQ-related RNA-binding protein n=1 Tax=Lapidilactobacillus gannanensis TaxID=2486002 RepID=A0ABW4BN51_9LACO|nr:YlxQ-related RNA-binding protein [Lapidilactobacillus gannanensis]
MTTGMKPQQQVLQRLGLARRAQKLVLGEEFVVAAAQKQQLALIFLASDTGTNTYKRIKNKANFYQIPLIEIFTADQLSQAIGQARKVIGVTDAGFAKGMVGLMQ